MPRTRAALLTLTILFSACQSSRISTPVPPAPTTSVSPQFTASPSPTAAPAGPTATPAPAPREFAENFDGDLPYWSFPQIDNGQPAAGPNVDSGLLVFDLPLPNQWVYAIYGGQDYADVRVDAQVETRAGADGALGIVCRYNESEGWYEFNIYADQTYELLFGQWLTQGVARYTPIYRGKSEKVKADANEIGLLCEGDVLTPFINGVQMRKWEEKKFGLKRGKIGLSASSFENAPLTIAYDWLKVSEP